MLDQTTETGFIQRQHRFVVSDVSPLQAIVERLEEENSHETSFYTDVRDFSRSGVKIVVPFEARFEEKLKIHLEFSGLDYVFDTTGVVRHIKADGDKFIAGCQINPTLPEPLIEYLADAAGKNRRKNPRTLVSGAGTMACSKDSKPVAIEFLNISEGGFCVRSIVAPEVDERVTFYSDLDEDIAVVTRVRWVKEDPSNEGQFLVGSSFTNANCYQVLLSSLTLEPEKAEITPNKKTSDDIRWYVIASCLFCAIMPPAASALTWKSSSHGAHDSVIERTETVDSPSLVVNDNQKQNPKPNMEPELHVESSLTTRINSEFMDEVRLVSPTDTPKAEQFIVADQCETFELPTIRQEELVSHSHSSRRKFDPNMVGASQTIVPDPEVKKPRRKKLTSFGSIKQLRALEGSSTSLPTSPPKNE